MQSTVLCLGLISLQLAVLASGQGYGNIEDDTAQQPQRPDSQQIHSLPQYESESPAALNPGPAAYGQAPANNLNSNPLSADQSQNQDYWWLNQNAFQRPAGHPGVEKLDQSAPQQKPINPNPNQGNRSPNSYNQPAPSQNSYQAPQPPKPQAFKPQNNQYQQNSPSFTNPSKPSGGGWQAPSAPSANFNLPSANAPAGNAFLPKPLVGNCELLNKADCHKGTRPVPSVPGIGNYQQSPSYEEPNDAGYNVPQPQQSYQPPVPQQPYQPQPQQPRPAPPAPQPSGYYQPPQSPQSLQPEPASFQPRPQAYPSNQNNEPQYSPDSQPESSYPIQTPQRPNPQPYRPQSPPPQQQYNKPAPPPPQQQYTRPPAPQQQPRPNQSFGQNSGQGIPPNNNQEEVQLPYPGCPAAMLCVNENRCNLIGIIEDPLTLSEADRANRVALSTCSEPMTGIAGICCRDPNYKDPWPDMQGKGGDHQHHHHPENKGQGQSSSQVQSPNNYQPNNYQPQPQQSQNPYADRKNGSRSIQDVTTTNAPKELKPLSLLQTCSANEACIIASKCQENFASNGLGDVKATGQYQRNSTSTKNLKKCREDPFRNAYVCCNINSPTIPNDINAQSSINHPQFQAPSFTTTRRPFQTGKYQPFQQSSPTLSTKPPGRNHNYQNNHLLTQTLAPELQTTTEFLTTPSSLITGLGLRFHSHLHTKSTVEANKLKPNPYWIQPAIISLNDSTLVNEPQTAAVDLFNAANVTLDSKVSNELQTSASSLKFSQETANNITLNETSTNVPIGNIKSDEKQTNETLSSNGQIGEATSNKTGKPVTLQPETFEKVDINKVPKQVALSDEINALPPFGFIFKGDNLYIPEWIQPSQNFLPPTKEFSDKSNMKVEEVMEATTNSGIDNETTVDSV